MSNDRIISPFTSTSTATEVVAGIDLSGKRAVVTGGSSGIGVETARALASAGAEVTIAVRNPEAGAQAAAEINAGLDHDRVSSAALDLLDLATVEAFARDWGRAPLHILVHNAGIMAAPLSRTPPAGSRSSPPITSGTSRSRPGCTTPWRRRERGSSRSAPGGTCARRSSSRT